MSHSPTILAWSSAAAAPRPNIAARAVIRISGGLTRGLLARVLATPLPHRPGATIARLKLAHHELPCLLVLWHAPRSYTGQDSAELILPASEPLVRRVLDAFLSLNVEGVRLAGPGEFTARAFAAGKLSLEEAEGVAAAIAAGTREELAAARDLMDGHAGAAYHALADELANLAALVEAGIDFTDQEDVVAIAPTLLAQRLDRAAADLIARLGSSTEHRAGRPLVAIVGSPNAGKSTLFNALLARTRTIASDIAGTTRDVVIEPLDLGACTIDLADTAGLDAHATGAIDAAARDRALAVARSAQLVLWCDPAARFDDPRLRLAAESRAILVRTRADQCLAHDLAHDLSQQRQDVLSVCALDGWGLSLLKDRIAREVVGVGNSGSVVVQRHRDVLTRVGESIARARAAVDPAARSLAQAELIASHLHAAIDAVGELTGRIERDEVIGRVFARFCVGK